MSDKNKIKIRKLRIRIFSIIIFILDLLKELLQIFAFLNFF